MDIELEQPESKFKALERVMFLESNGFQFVEVKDEAQAAEVVEWLKEHGAVVAIERNRELAPAEKSFGVLSATKQILGRRRDVRADLQKLFPEIIEEEIEEAEKIKEKSVVVAVRSSQDLIAFLHYSRDQLLNKASNSLCVFIVTTQSAAQIQMPPDLRSVLGMTIEVE